MKYRKKPVEIEAHQWFKNGDHPDDLVGKMAIDEVKLFDLRPDLLDGDGQIADADVPDEARYERIEGVVVRFFRRPEPEYAGGKVHDACGYTWHEHGWIDTLEGGHTVCPGDFIITGVQGERYPCKPDIFAETYEPVEVE
jgi:hypothetical protein